MGVLVDQDGFVLLMDGRVADESCETECCGGAVPNCCFIGQSSQWCSGAVQNLNAGVRHVVNLTGTVTGWRYGYHFATQTLGTFYRDIQVDLSVRLEYISDNPCVTRRTRLSGHWFKRDRFVAALPDQHDRDFDVTEDITNATQAEQTYFGFLNEAGPFIAWDRKLAKLGEHAFNIAGVLPTVNNAFGLVGICNGAGQVIRQDANNAVPYSCSTISVPLRARRRVIIPLHEFFNDFGLVSRGEASSLVDQIVTIETACT